MKRERRIYRRLTPLEQAKATFHSRFAAAVTEPEIVRVREGLNRVLTRPVRAAVSVPAYHAAAMDGIAVRAAKTFDALPESPVFLEDGKDARAVDTGDPIPNGCDAVVLIEDVEQAGGMWEVRQGVYPWQNVRKAGEDIVKEEIVLAARHRLGAFDQGALLAAGVLEVEVFRRPRVLIVPTGDEIVLPEEAPRPIPAGAILEVNGQMLSSMAAEAGAEVTLLRPVPDDREALRRVLTDGVSTGYDVILMIAGSSAGSEDYTPGLIEEIGELMVHGVAVMPGKPMLLASARGRAVIGIPGYPVSAVTAFREFVRPLLFSLQGVPVPEAGNFEAVLARKVPSKLGIEEHVRVVVGKVGETLTALPISGGASVLTSLVRADGILRIPREESGLSEGETVRVECFCDAESLNNKLLAVGSHDLTIDLLGSMIRERSRGRFAISSSNVGSLSGLIAVGRGTAHFAGAHLLDVETGDYNRRFVRQYLGQTPVALITLVHRWQGFLVASGNPKGVAGIRDLARQDVSFINRQTGSGTRILLDYALKRAGIAASAVSGYRNEEYTHMSVAMAVHSGRADAGLGIRAAANALELEFVPLARERYDLVIPQKFLNDEKIELLLEIIRSEEFARHVLGMGGYEIDDTGKTVDLSE
jgi:molybdenum cofactor synthesis domain-containing protein